MRRSPRNVKIAFSHAGLTHYGGILFFNEFSRMLQLRRFLTRRLRYPRRSHDYQLSQMILSLVYPIILGLDRLETASLLRSNGTFQYLTGLPTYPTPQSLRRFCCRPHPIFGSNSTASMTICCSTSFTGPIITSPHTRIFPERPRTPLGSRTRRLMSSELCE
jgi:hypothetical protein